MTTTIYAFINSRSSDWFETIALHPDGRILAGHASSSETWAKHDIGATSDMKHDKYRAACPEGFVVEWVDEPRKHAGIEAAIHRHELTALAEKAAL